VKAVEVLKRCPVWFAPRPADDSPSTALDIVRAAVSDQGKEIITHTFPMKKIHMDREPAPEAARAWEEAAALVSERLAAGLEVAFPTLGDPSLYSTAFYVCGAVLASSPRTPVEIVPGVSSISAAAALCGRPLCQGNERMVVIPATYGEEAIAEAIFTHDTVVLMKVHRVLERIRGMLDRLGLADRAVLVERAGQAGERVARGLGEVDPAAGCHYFSTIIVSRKKAA
jgi:precorrin-2/cobalt-factor-2 C20-methyltransferase